jgi:hypothetical protein
MPLLRGLFRRIKMGMRNIEISQVRFGRDVVGFCVSALVRDCPDSLWESISHNAIFKTKERAERYLASQKKIKPNLKNWRLSASWDGAFSVL